jgi:hypothetical protein
MVENDYHGIISEEFKWHLLQTPNLVHSCLLKIQTTPLQRHQVLASAVEPMLVVTMPIIDKTLKSVIDKMTYGTSSKLQKLFQVEIAKFSREDMCTKIFKLDYQWYHHLVSYDTLTSRG